VKKRWGLLPHALPINPVPGPKFAGVMACGRRHRGPGLGKGSGRKGIEMTTIDDRLHRSRRRPLALH
jgi:hypothetical protein